MNAVTCRSEAKNLASHMKHSERTALKHYDLAKRDKDAARTSTIVEGVMKAIPLSVEQQKESYPGKFIS